MKPHIVVGLGFGDEGKGRTVSYLASTLTGALVVKVGGHQAGHTVNTRNKHHIFSNIPAGYLDGADSYISEYCTVYLLGLVIELNELNKKDPNNNSIIYVNKHCVLTTPFDIVANQSDVINISHGTCGMGINTTFIRESNNYHLTVDDIFNPTVFFIKLEQISKYYGITVGQRMDIFSDAYVRFRELVSQGKIVIVDEMPSGYYNYIFETGQGILLDQRYGFFPHVTRFSTTSEYGIKLAEASHMGTADIYYVTRTYQTRHGNGPMTSENENHIKFDASLETNKTNTFQGKLRIGKLDVDLLNYALQVDSYSHTALNVSHKHLVLTCVDQLPDPEQIPLKNGISTKDLNLNLNVKFTTTYHSYGSETNELKERNVLWD